MYVSPQSNWAINTRVDPTVQLHIQRERLSHAVNPEGITKRGIKGGKK